MTDTPDARLLRELFDGGADLPPAEQAEYLLKHCPPELQRHVESLFAFDRLRQPSGPSEASPTRPQTPLESDRIENDDQGSHKSGDDQHVAHERYRLIQEVGT